ncbi:hypothetical protein ACFV5G_09965 [Streptomyces sp. NPDC059766]|uniref:hypothetical protein n=1 Tax=Streptomyces sp. NPDC059766 TaxID=3346940 RepID=UPI00365713F0
MSAACVAASGFGGMPTAASAPLTSLLLTAAGALLLAAPALLSPSLSLLRAARVTPSSAVTAAGPYPHR